MATNTHQSLEPDTSLASSAHQPTHMPLRVALIVLAAIVALTAIPSAIFVVPALPPGWLHQG
ncbi:MAG TPA: hypothetical protein VFU63_04200 [Ktedonobacterales bacterium]|nr:hypothetical protein [Ktedonobacterales bacterium]